MTAALTDTQTTEVDAAPADVLALLAGVDRRPEWARAFVDSVEPADAPDRWTVTKDGRAFVLRVVVHQDSRTVDYLPGEQGEVGGHVRVLPSPGGGSVVLFITQPLPGADAARTARTTVAAELSALRTDQDQDQDLDGPAGGQPDTARGAALRFAFLVLYVPDLTGTLASYQEAFDLPSRVHPNGQHAELDTGPVTPAFTQDELSATELADLTGGYHPNRPDRPPPGLDLAFATEEVDAAWDRAVEAGARVVIPIVVKPSGQRVGYLGDLNGVLVEIGAPLDDALDLPPQVAGR